MSAPHLPFAGLKVVDLSHFWSGPYLTMYLGAYGADVIKVESPQRPDAWRYNHTAPVLGDRWFDRGTLWQACNLDKRDLTLDLNQPEAQELLLKLCADADVFVENFSTKVLQRFGISYERLKAINPAIIMMRLPGFGLEGPWQDYVGWGDAFEQIAGLTLVTGYPDGRPQIPGGYMDPIVGMHAATALLAALDHRERTGEGQLVEVVQIEVGVSMSAGLIISAELGDKQGRMGNRTPGYAPQGVYRCADEGEEFVALSVRGDAEWGALLDLIGRPADLEALAGAGLAARHAAHDAIDAAIQRWAGALPVEQAEAALLGAGIPAARLLRPVRYNQEPQLAARDYYQELDHPLSGPRQFPTFPMHFSFETDHAVFRSPAPMLGQHNDEVLAELGLGPDDRASLAERRITGTKPLGGAS
ncbi:MAG: CoA transferase [Alphaproteobacteria bacterium]|nr:CoA transferase [Alphaproteobacteria bacterium]